MKHVRLTDLVNEGDKAVRSSAKEAADRVADEGGSPSAQIKAARKESGQRLTYNAHVGAKQGERNLRQLAKKFLPCPICHGIEGCDHTVNERREKWNAELPKL